MNTASDTVAPASGAGGWSRRRFFLVVFFAAAIHVAGVYFFGTHKIPTIRPVTNIPQLQMVSDGSEIAALLDPTLFALPHELLDFAPAGWLKPPEVDEPAFHRAQSEPLYLAPVAEDMGAKLGVFLQERRISMLPLEFKPTPELVLPDINLAATLPKRSSLKIFGVLASRPALILPAVPDLPCNDVIGPSRVQVVVDADGNVISAILLDSSEYDAADRKALELARQARFAPGSRVALGEFLFTWHTVPEGQP